MEKRKRHLRRITARSILFVIIAIAFISCATVDPRKVDVEIESELPAIKRTALSQALPELGQMTLLFGSDLVFIMIDGGIDYTGTSVATGGEIPYDIKEMIKSTINAIGGNVYFVPNNTRFMIEMVQAGHTTYDRKYSPHVLLSSGITEFDRGLDTRGRNEDLGIATNDDKAGIEYQQLEKKSIANITLDLNMLDFHANVGIPRMQTVNSIRVHKGLAEAELGLSLYGPTFGLKGTIKKVGGRHAAVRLLVQFSIVQIIGKYFDIPYWRLLEGVPPDPIVLSTLANDFHNMNELAQIVKIKECLYLHGYDIPINDEMDPPTIHALKHFFRDSIQGAFDRLTSEMFIRLYTSIPIEQTVLDRRMRYNQLLQEFIVSLNVPAPQEQSDAVPSGDDSPKTQEKAPAGEDTSKNAKKTEPQSEEGDKDTLMRMLDMLGKKERPPLMNPEPLRAPEPSDSSEISPKDQW
jgi:hypothetical protein